MSSRPAPRFLVGSGLPVDGIAALRTHFDEALQSDASAFLVAAALDTEDRSRLVAALRDEWALTVVDAEAAPAAQPGYAYVVPLRPTTGTAEPPSSDGFFRTLTDAWQGRAVGAVLLPVETGQASDPGDREPSREALEAQIEALRAENAALREEAAEAAYARRDLRHLIGATEVAALFLDHDLRVLRYTPRVRDHFALEAGDAGRPLSALPAQFDDAGLEADVRRTAEDLTPRQREVRHADGRWHLLHLRPYRRLDGTPSGVVLTFTDITRQKRQEAELRASTEQFNALVDASAQVVWQTNSEGLLTMPSRSLEAFTGQRAEEQYGYGWSDSVHPEDRARLMAEWEATVASSGPLETEVRFWHAATGTWRWMAARGVPLHDDDGTLRGYVGMNVDVTELREAKVQAEQQLHTFGAALGSFEDFIYVFDLDGRFTYVNRPLLDLWEVTAAEALGKTFTDLGYPPPLAELHQRQIEEVIRTAAPVRAGNAYVSPRGVEGVYEYIFTPVFDADGRVAAVAGVTRDVTEPRRAEAALRRNEEQLRQALAVADTGTWVHEFSDGVTRFDDRARAIFGLTGPTLPTSDVPPHIHPRDLEALARQHDDDADAPPIFTDTHRVVRDDGSVRWVRGQTRVFAEPDADGTLRPVRAIGVVVDVTEQQQAAEEIHRLTATLEDRVAARTHQVRQLNALLASAEQEERRRIAHVLHDDLQQLLASLSITLTLLRDPDADNRAALQDHAQQIVERSIGLTRSLAADLSPPVLSDVRLAPLLGWLAERHRTLHRLEVSVEVEEPCAVEDADVRALLYHSLREVLFNVVKHANTGAASVRAYPSGPYAVVEVEDEGTGFAVGDGRRDATTNGFGLASVRERLHLADGALEITSAPGRGTRVVLRVLAGARPDGMGT